MSMRSTSVALGFASIAIPQLALGIWMVTLAVKEGGNSKFLYPDPTPYSEPERLLVLFLLRLYSPNPPTDTS